MAHHDQPSVPRRPPPGSPYGQEIWEDLLANGLIDEHGQTDPAFVELLPLLSRGETEFFGTIKERDQVWSVLVSANSDHAILVKRHEERLEVSEIPNEDLAEAVVSALPRCRPARGRTLSANLAPVGGGHDPAPSDHKDIVAFQRLVASRRGEGQLWVAVGPDYRRTPFERPIYYVDTPDGRWLIDHSRHPHGEYRFSVSPASAADITAALYEEHQRLIADR